MNTANRVLWAVVGVLLLALGVLGTLASLGRLPWLKSGTALLPTSLNANWHRFGFWAPLVAIAVGVVLVALGLLLLRAELRRRSHRPMPALVLPAPTPGGGTTFVGSDTLEKALSRDLARSRHLTDATAYLTGDPSRPTVALRLAVSPGADLSQVKHVVDGALHRFAATSGVSPTVSDVDVRVAAATASSRKADRSRVH
jgi:hypothetical protein